MKKYGFTLMELLLVVAIMIIIVGAMVPLFNISREDAREAKAKAELDAIKSAATMYFSDTGNWPRTGSVGADLVTNTGGSTAWKGPYLDAWGPDPWVNTYQIYDSGTVQRRVQALGKTSVSIILTPSWR